VISAAHRERVEGYVEMGRSEGATIAAGGERPDMERGFYVAPTLLADATNDMTPVREEIFGPVVAVVPVDDAEEALAVANDSDFGLYSYVFTADTGGGAGHGQADSLRQRWPQHAAAQPRGPLRWVQAVRRGARWRLLRPACLQ